MQYIESTSYKEGVSVPVIFLELSLGSLYLMNLPFSCYLLHQVGLCLSEPENNEKTINSRYCSNQVLVLLGRDNPRI